jgi:hypothetical protein
MEKEKKKKSTRKIGVREGGGVFFARKNAPNKE